MRCYGDYGPDSSNDPFIAKFVWFMPRENNLGKVE